MQNNVGLISLCNVCVQISESCLNVDFKRGLWLEISELKSAEDVSC